MPDARHNGQEEKKENMAKSEDPNYDCNTEISLGLKNLIMEGKYGTSFSKVRERVNIITQLA